MPIENRNLEPGTVLTAKYKKLDRTCELVQTGDGLRYRLDDGTEHKSPSSAGKTAMGGVACNGWRFWSVQGTEKPKAKAELRSEPKPKVEKSAKAPPKKKPATKPTAKKSTKPKAMRAKASDNLYGCGVCSETFPTQKAAVAHAMTHTS